MTLIIPGANLITRSKMAPQSEFVVDFAMSLKTAHCSAGLLLPHPRRSLQGTAIRISQARSYHPRMPSLLAP